MVMSIGYEDGSEDDKIFFKDGKDKFDMSIVT